MAVLDYEQKFMFPEMKQKQVRDLLALGYKQIDGTDLYGHLYRGTYGWVKGVSPAGEEIDYAPIFESSVQWLATPQIKALQTDWDKTFDVPSLMVSYADDRSLVHRLRRKPGPELVYKYTMDRDVSLKHTLRGKKISLIKQAEGQPIEEQLTANGFEPDPRSDRIFRRRYQLEDDVVEFLGILVQGQLQDIFQGDWKV